MYNFIIKCIKQRMLSASDTTVNVIAEYDEHSCIDDSKVSTSIGTIVYVDDKQYILTTLHGVANSTTIYTSNYNELTVSNSSDELDTVLLDIDTELPVSSTYFFDTKIPSYGDKLTLCDKKITTCTVDSVETVRYNSCNTIDIPYINITVDDPDFYTDDLHGLSGSLVSGVDGVVGMVVRMKDRLIVLLPSCFIKLFIENKPFKGLCYPVFDYFVAELSLSDEQTVYGLIVTETHTSTIFKQDKIVLEIDGKQFNSTGEIHSSTLDIHIPVSTYIALNKGVVTSKIVDTDGYIEDISTKIPETKLSKYIPVLGKYTVYNYKGLILTELTEQIIEYYREQYPDITGNWIKNYLETPYTDTYSRIVVVVGTDKYSEFYNNYKDIGLPVITEYRIPVLVQLTKIGNKKITDINLLNEYIDKEQCTVTLATDSYLIKLKYVKNRLNVTTCS